MKYVFKLLWPLVAFADSVLLAEESPERPPIAPSSMRRVIEPAHDHAHHGHDHAHDGHAHTPAHAHGKHLHFDHPILTEVPTPHNVLSLSYAHERSADRVNTDTLELGFEFAPVRWFSFEVATPVQAVNPDQGSYSSGVGSSELAVKFASFHFEHKGIVLAAGVEFELPTGDDARELGSNNEVIVEPFVTMGWKHGRLELVSVFSYGMPVKRSSGDPFVPDFGFQLSTLYHFHDKVAALVEVRGETELRGEDRGRTVIEVAPGLKFKPWTSQPLELGVNAILPVTHDRELNWGAGFAIFYHF